jgi:hypothetical protein
MLGDAAFPSSLSYCLLPSTIPERESYFPSLVNNHAHAAKTELNQRNVAYNNYTLLKFETHVLEIVGGPGTRSFGSSNPGRRNGKGRTGNG